MKGRQHFVASSDYGTMISDSLLFIKLYIKMLIFPGNFMAKIVWYY